MKCLLAVLMFLCCGCQTLNVEYGTYNDNSLNGFSILKQHWQEQFNGKTHRKRSDRLDNVDVIIHPVRMPFGFSLGDPDADADEALASVDLDDEYYDDEYYDEEELDDIDYRSPSAWLRDWLQAGEKRQFVLILRDGNIAPQLCKEWADEYSKSAAEEGDPEKKEQLEKQATRLNEIGANNIEAPIVQHKSTQNFYWFKVHGKEPQQIKRLSGIYDNDAPHTLRSKSSLSSDNGETVLMADEHVHIMSIPVDDSRIIVIANATALVDGALVDKHARSLLEQLTAFINTWEPQSSVWLHSLNAGSNAQPPNPNILSMLFTKEPFNYVIIHALALLIAYLFWRAAWLGRKHSHRQAVEEHFSKHIAALARHLRMNKNYQQQYTAIAQYIGKASLENSPATSDAEAIAQLQELYQQNDQAQDNEKASS